MASIPWLYIIWKKNRAVFGMHLLHVMMVPTFKTGCIWNKIYQNSSLIIDTILQMMKEKSIIRKKKERAVLVDFHVKFVIYVKTDSKKYRESIPHIFQCFMDIWSIWNIRLEEKTYHCRLRILNCDTEYSSIIIAFSFSLFGQIFYF